MPSVVRNLSEHPAGPMTIFFWAPTSKWLLSVNNLMDLKKGSSKLCPIVFLFFFLRHTFNFLPSIILIALDTDKMSLAQQIALTSTGVIWTRYSFVITPVNYNLAIVNAVLGVSSGYHLTRKINNDYINKGGEKM